MSIRVYSLLYDSVLDDDEVIQQNACFRILKLLAFIHDANDRINRQQKQTKINNAYIFPNTDEKQFFSIILSLDVVDFSKYSLLDKI